MSGVSTRGRVRGTGSARSVVGSRERTPWPWPIAVGVAAWVIALGAVDPRSVTAATGASPATAGRPVAASGAGVRDTGGLPYLDGAHASGYAAFVIERLDAGAASDARPTLALLARAPGVTPALGAAARVLQETLDGTGAAPGVRAASAHGVEGESYVAEEDGAVLGESVSTLYLDAAWLELALPPPDVDSASLTLGRQGIADARGWWWDDSLDLVALALSVAAGGRIAGDAFGESIDPEEDGVAHVLFEATREWDGGQRLAAGALLERDRFSDPDTTEALVERAEIDPLDASLEWYGLALHGIGALGDAAALDYRVDVASVRGSERELDADDGSSSRRRVGGWALDTGLILLPTARRWPELSVGHATTSAEADPEDDVDRGFRQSGLHGNTSEIGSSGYVSHHGLALDPELANLEILSVGLAAPFGQGGSSWLGWHRYSQRAASTSLRGASVDLEPLGDSTDIGQGADFAIALPLGESWWSEVALGGFEAGRAFGERRGERRLALDWSVYLSF